MEAAAYETLLALAERACAALNIESRNLAFESITCEGKRAADGRLRWLARGVWRGQAQAARFIVARGDTPDSALVALESKARAGFRRWDPKG